MGDSSSSRECARDEGIEKPAAAGFFISSGHFKSGRVAGFRSTAQKSECGGGVLRVLLPNVQKASNQPLSMGARYAELTHRKSNECFRH